MDSLSEKIPPRIDRLEELAFNLWWAFSPKARELFRRIDHPLWRKTGQDPVKMLIQLNKDRLEKLSRDPSLLKLYDSVIVDFDSYLGSNNVWFSQEYREHSQAPIAFICAEFGIHQSLPIYSGGLGVLAGDICKEASDLGIPIIGIGFIYPQGYFRQKIPSHGWQEAIYDQFDFSNAPIRPVIRDGKQLVVSVKLQDREIHVRVWYITIGRITVYLMDTDIESNAPWDRELSARLYWDDQDIRLRWELVLGFGSVKVLEALKIKPKLWHMNEGHTAFQSIQRISQYMKSGLSFSEAKKQVVETNRFTTHTPVPAGHDEFPFATIENYCSNLWENDFSITRREFMELGSVGDKSFGQFNMTALAINTSKVINAVSALNQEVASEMWKDLMQKSFKQNKLKGITNGVHTATWVSGYMQNLFSKHLGSRWYDQHDFEDFWTRLDDIPDRELWKTHLMNKNRLFDFIRERNRFARVSMNMNPDQIMASGVLLDSQALTLGFARRFATYKRPNLIFRQLERLKKIILDPYRPVQVIFAGKAHPADDPSKHLLQQVYEFAKNPELGGRIAFLENYNMQAARYLVQGVDVWLNTPRRPYEASGTSGQKASMNGVPNFSVLDGWWDEGYTGANGWVIGQKDSFNDLNKQDDHDAESFYSILENEIVPLFYSRKSNETPHEWVKIQKEAIKSSISRFSARRMLKEYAKKSYFPSNS